MNQMIVVNLVLRSQNNFSAKECDLVRIFNDSVRKFYALLFPCICSYLFKFTTSSDGATAALSLSDRHRTISYRREIAFGRIISLAENTNVTGENLSNLFPTSVKDGEDSSTTINTTVFNTDADVVVNEPLRPIRIPNSIVSKSTDEIHQDLKDFLQKPVLVSSGNLNTTDTASTFTAINFPTFYGTVDLYKQKFKGNYGVRMDLRFRLVLNANRFQMGRYMLVWLPFGGSDLGINNVPRWNAAHVFSLTQRSQLPHAEIDLNCDTEVELLIPFASAVNFVNINKTINNSATTTDLGSIDIYPYVPLTVASGPTTCGYSLWVSAENIELYGTVVPQSRGFSVKKGKSISEKERESGGMGAISSTLMRIKRTADLFTKVPALSAYGTTVSWMSEILAGAASNFGYCRPTNLQKIDKMGRFIYAYLPNCDGPDNSTPMSLSYKNTVANVPAISGCDIDEMDFSYLVTIPSYVSTVDVTDTTTSGTVIFNLDCLPSQMYTSVTVNTDILVNYAPAAFLSTQFRNWRGSMVFKFKFVKTEFHSGRFLICFQPSDEIGGTASTPDLTTSAYLHREIIDVRCGNEFTFVVPYIATTPYLPFNKSFGKLFMFVLDPIVAPATVPSKVSIICERAMGADTEFAVPQFSPFLPCMGVVPQMGALDDPLSNECSRVEGTLGSSSVKTDVATLASMCVGEKISSIRTLLKRPIPITVFPGAAVTGNKYISIFPFHYDANYVNGATTNIAGSWTDLFGMFSSMYLFSRGGVRLKMINTTTSLINSAVISQTYSRESQSPTSAVTAGTSTSYGTGNLNDQDFGNLRFTSLAQDTHEIEIPQYWKTYSRLNSIQWTNPSATVTVGNTPLHNAGSVTYCAMDQTTVVKPTIYRAAADDFQLGLFISIPPMYSKVGGAFYNSWS